MWQNLLRKKYLKKYTLSKVSHKLGDTHFWSGLMRVKDSVLTSLVMFMLSFLKSIWEFWRE
jgi:hypothetical protein